MISRSEFLSRPELLAPAGDWECVHAAVENGADAVYFGLDRFNARMRAANFTVADLPRLLEFLHRRGVKAFVTFNVLVFPNELDDAEMYLRSIITAGVDAAIIQDAGICRLIRRLSPDFPIHASTQMTISSGAGLELARDLGCCLVALARECAVAEIGKMRPEQRASLDLEVFVHGALCVAYSGQCLTSESLGGRSANRGVCAQACRLPYELICDNQPVALGDRRYLLSPRDLAGFEVLPDLMRLGIKVLKIEGRLKSPEYVANITRVYREAIDRCWATFQRATAAPEANSSLILPQLRPTPAEQYRLEMAFSRGLHTGWFKGINNQQLVHARFGKKRGVYLGQVARLEKNRVGVQLEGPLKPGDGIVFDAGRPDQDEEGGRVYTVENRSNVTWLSFGHGALNTARVHVGDRVWKTSDPALDRQLRQSFEVSQPGFSRPVWLRVEGATGQPLVVTAWDELGHRVEAVSARPLIPAQKQPLTTERLAEQLGRLGGTAFRLEHLDNRLIGQVILPLSDLNELRRRWVTELDAQRARPPAWSCPPTQDAGPAWRALAADFQTAVAQRPQPESPASPELIVLVRDLAQLDSALRCGTTTIYCEFEDPKRYREAVRIFAEAGNCADRERSIWVAPPRISKPGEDWILNQVRSSHADGYLVRNYDHLQFFAGCRCIGDFSLNVANPLSAGHFLERFGLERVTASYDLNETQLADLLRTAPPDWFEVTIHHHMPMFHMEHCVFCAFLSKGTDFTNCGRPCEKHRVRLRDRVGAEHELRADAGCRNTVFNSRAQTGAEAIGNLVELGLRYFRVEFLSETPAEVAQTIALYRQVLRRELPGTELWRRLKLLNHLGVTRGPE